MFPLSVSFSDAAFHLSPHTSISPFGIPVPAREGTSNSLMEISVSRVLSPFDLKLLTFLNNHCFYPYYTVVLTSFEITADSSDFQLRNRFLCVLFVSSPGFPRYLFSREIQIQRTVESRRAEKTTVTEETRRAKVNDQVAAICIDLFNLRRRYANGAAARKRDQ